MAGLELSAQWRAASLVGMASNMAVVDRTHMDTLRMGHQARRTAVLHHRLRTNRLECMVVGSLVRNREVLRTVNTAAPEAALLASRKVNSGLKHPDKATLVNQAQVINQDSMDSTTQVHSNLAMDSKVQVRNNPTTGRQARALAAIQVRRAINQGLSRAATLCPKASINQGRQVSLEAMVNSQDPVSKAASMANSLTPVLHMATLMKTRTLSIKHTIPMAHREVMGVSKDMADNSMAHNRQILAGGDLT